MKVAIAGSRNVQVLNLEADKSFPPPGSKSTSLYCGSIFDPPSKRKKTPQTVRFAGIFGAGNVTRTHDLLITNRIRCKNLGKTGLFSPFLAVESSGQHSFPERHHTHIFRCGSERGSAEEKDRISCTSYFELHKQRNKLRQDMPSFKSMKMCISVITY